jgi:hypothetical protein
LLQLAVKAHRGRHNIATDLACRHQDGRIRLHFDSDIVDGYFEQFLFFRHVKFKIQKSKFKSQKQVEDATPDFRSVYAFIR